MKTLLNFAFLLLLVLPFSGNGQIASSLQIEYGFSSGYFKDYNFSPLHYREAGHSIGIEYILQPDGTSLDGIGHIPDVYIKNTIADIQAGNDRVLERAVDYLFEKYGIE